MTDQTPPKDETTHAESIFEQPSQSDLVDELRELGENIKSFLHALWESQERKQVQQEIETGMAELGASLSKAAGDFQQSPTGQRIQEEFKEIGERIRSGEIEATIRQDFLSALRTANSELEKVLKKMASTETEEANSTPGPET